MTGARPTTAATGSGQGAGPGARARTWPLRRLPVTAWAELIAVMIGVPAMSFTEAIEERGILSTAVADALILVLFLIVLASAARALLKSRHTRGALRLEPDALSILDERGEVRFRAPTNDLHSAEVLRFFGFQMVTLGFTGRDRVEIRARDFASRADARELVDALRALRPSDAVASRAALAERLGAPGPVTVGFLATLGVVFAAQVAGGAFSFEAVVAAGALDTQALLAGEWQRAFTHVWLHSSFTHVASNGLLILLLGTVLERIVGSERFVLALGASALAAALAYSSLGPRVAVGCSAAVYAGMGVHLAVLLRRRDELPTALRPRPLLVGIYLAVILLTDPVRLDVAWQAHFVGMAVGLLSCSVLLGDLPLTAVPSARPRWLVAAAWGVVSAYLAAAVSVLVAIARLPPA